MKFLTGEIIVKWRSHKELPQINQMICCYATHTMYVAEYIGKIKGDGFDIYPHMIIRDLEGKIHLDTFDAITARFWIPFEDIEKDIKGE